MIIQSADFIENPLVSVVIPSYNRAETVNQTIDSILNQRCNFDFEIVIGDDCSTDNAREVLKAYQNNYPDKIKLIFHDVNIGLGANWATCVKHCRGKYIANCDNDDYWHNVDKLQLQVDYMEANIQCGVCHTYHRDYFQQKNIYTEKLSNPNDKINEPLYLAVFNIRGFECCNSSILYRSDILNKHLNLDDYIKHQFTLQDWNTWVILAQHTKFYCLPICTTTILLDNNSITRNKDYDKMHKRLLKEEETFLYVASKIDIPIHNVNDYKIYMYNVLLNISISKFNFTKAKEAALKLISYGDKNRRIKTTKSKLHFYLYCTAKYFKQLYFSLKLKYKK